MRFLSGFSVIQPPQTTSLAKQSFLSNKPLPANTAAEKKPIADVFFPQLKQVSLRSGYADSPNFPKAEDRDKTNFRLTAFEKKFNQITAEDSGLTEDGYRNEPSGWQSFCFGTDKNLSTIRSKFMGSLRSQDWLNKMLPSIQNLRDKTSDNTDDNRFIFSSKPLTVADIQGEQTEIQTPRFCFPKPRSSDGVFRLPLLGDPGYNNATLKYNLAAIKALPEALGYIEGGDYQWDCLLSMGDNLYSEKDPASSSKAPINQSGHPDHFWNNVGKAYQPFLTEDIPFFTTLGNHEVKNGYQEKVLNYLDLPSYYRMSFGGENNGNGACVEIFVINMAWLGISDAVKLQEKEAGSVEDAEAEIKEQNAWLLYALEDSMKTNPKARRLVVGHYPIFQQDHAIDKAFAKEFRYSMGKIYKHLQDKEIEVDGEKPAPMDMWLNGHVHKFTVNQSDQLATDEGEVFELTSPLTQWATGNTAHCELLGSDEEWSEEKTSSEGKYAEEDIGLDSMKVLCQQVTTGFSVMEIDPKNAEKPIKLAFLQPPMTPHKVKEKQEEGTYWWGQLVETGEMSKAEAHAENYKSLYSVML